MARPQPQAATKTPPLPFPEDDPGAVPESGPNADVAPCVLGAGLTTLDAIWSGDPSQPPTFRAGGTCGNVLIILAAMGWRSYPIARLGDDPAGALLRREWERWSVRLDFAKTTAESMTPILFQRLDRGPNPVFFRTCPRCGTIPRWHQPISKTAALALARGGRWSRPSVFFFDQPTAGAIALARACAEQGALVMFEPPIARPSRLVREAIEIAHVVKWSQQNLGGVKEIEAWNRCKLLSVNTLGALGLRWRRGSNDDREPEWRTLPPWPAAAVHDAAGCGDWCSAALLHRLGRNGPSGLARASDAEIANAIREAQAWAAWNCRFFGARGGMAAPLSMPSLSVESLSSPFCPFCLPVFAVGKIPEDHGGQSSQFGVMARIRPKSPGKST